MNELDLFEEAAERQTAPPSPTFFEDFWRAAEQRQRRSARRWRRTAFAFALLAATATAAAGVMASSQSSATVIDRTMKCHVSEMYGARHVSLNSSVTTPRNQAYLRFTTRPAVVGPVPWALALEHTRTPITWEARLCKPARVSVALGPSGLPAEDVVTDHFVGAVSIHCGQPSTDILFRARITTSGGKPVRTKLAIRDAKTGKPLVFVDWSTTRIATWFASTCTSYPA